MKTTKFIEKYKFEISYSIMTITGLNLITTTMILETIIGRRIWGYSLLIGLIIIYFYIKIANENKNI